MPVDFAFRKEPALRTLSKSWKGPWQDRRIRKEFERVERALRAQGLRPGRWIYSGDYENSRWLVAIEARGRPKSGDGFRVKTFAASRVASVVFDPKVVSPRVIYHGISDWLRWRKKDKKIRRAGMYPRGLPGKSLDRPRRRSPYRGPGPRFLDPVKEGTRMRLSLAP